ncbi:MAG: YbaK/EbsC family protein [Burkholderiales bacterium]|nr:MAG: YbaK/EbsC family protein [Burkholderiales bacterium]
MPIPIRLQTFLLEHGAQAEVCAHRHSRTSSETARAAHVPPHLVAKAVVLEDDSGCLVAVVPADRFVRLGLLARQLERPQLRLADESRIAELFPDCERGAVPALGMAWGLETVVDEELESADTVYFECGDHEQLVKLSRAQFHELMQAAPHGRFSSTRLH